MGITYKDLIFLLRGRVMKSPLGGVFGCPGSYLLGLPIITDNCRAKENLGKEGFDNSCRECWNAEVPYPVIAEVIGDTDFPGVPEEYFEIGKKYLLRNCVDSETIAIGNENGLYIEGNKKGFKFYIQEEEMKKEFTKADLKDGMMVVERNGYGYIWLYGAKRDDCECFHDTRNDLTSIRGRKHDIIKVGYPKVDSYDLTGVERILCSVNSGFTQIIWEREEKEISSEEAFAILKQHYGCDVKIREK